LTCLDVPWGNFHREFTASAGRPRLGKVPRMTGWEVAVAGPGDAGTVLGLLRAASLARATADGPVWRGEFPDVVRDLPAGLVHLARIDGRVAGTFVLRWSDEKVWGPDDGDGGYLHRLATDPAVAGQGLGGRLISAAAGLTRERGRGWLRLDCPRDNPRLRAYYEGLGFRHAGDVENIPRQSGSGFRFASRYQRPA
jgi:GNAT superfamily N-acetyltransferase